MKSNSVEEKCNEIDASNVLKMCSSFSSSMTMVLNKRQLRKRKLLHSIPFKVNFKPKSILVGQDPLVDCKFVYPIPTSDVIVVIGVDECSFKFVLFVTLRLLKS